MNLPYTVDIVGDEMVVLDENGNDWGTVISSSVCDLPNGSSGGGRTIATSTTPGHMMKVEEFFSTTMQRGTGRDHQPRP